MLIIFSLFSSFAYYFGFIIIIIVVVIVVIITTFFLYYYYIIICVYTLLCFAPVLINSVKSSSLLNVYYDFYFTCLTP